MSKGEVPQPMIPSIGYMVGSQWTVVAVVAVGLFFLLLKRNFNTWSVFTAYSTVKSNSAIRERYLQLFTTRDNLLYHIGSSRSHGENELAKKLMRELDLVDKVGFFLFIFSIFTTIS